MTREELIDYGEMYLEVNEDSKNTNTYEFIEEALKLFKQKPCKDTVSRQVVKDNMIKYGFHSPGMTVEEFAEDELPPATPSLKKGFKFAEEITDEIEARGQVELPEGSVSGEEFEEWLHFENNKTKNGQTIALMPGAVIMPGDKFC